MAEGTKQETGVQYPAESDIWPLLHETFDLMSRARENELRQFGISTIQSAVLFMVKNSTVPVTPSSISRCLIRQPHAVSRLLDRMERNGLVKKVKDLERQNLIRVTLTEKGEAVYRRSRENRKVIPEILSLLSQEDQRKLATYLQLLRDESLKVLREPHPPPFEWYHGPKRDPDQLVCF